MKTLPIRHGDVNLIPISEEQFNKVKGKVIEHNGSYVLARGEATGSAHTITTEKKQEMKLVLGNDNNLYLALTSEAKITHTHDHEILTTPKVGFYIQVAERELDHFANSVVRRVQD
jgi:hypothetical protein